MVRSTVIVLALIGCDAGVLDEDRLVQEGAVPAGTTYAWSWPPGPSQPPPPPPPPPPRPLPVPDEITTFVRTHASDPEPWRVTLYELVDDESGRRPSVMGRRVVRERVLGRAASVQLVARLVQPIYQDGECGCVTSTSLGIRIARGRGELDLVYNAGHLFVHPFAGPNHLGRSFSLVDADWLADLHARM